MPRKSYKQSSRKAKQKPATRRSLRPLRSPLRKWLLTTSCILAILILAGFGWAEWRVRTFLHARRQGSFQVMGVRGALTKGDLTPLPLLASSPSYRGEKQLKLKSFHPLLVQAVLLTEDRRFYDHIGIDPVGIVRAILSNLSAGGIVQGASTITQQLAKNLFLSQKRTFVRKIQELFISLTLEFHLTKEELLSLYLNEVYLGQEGRTPVHGFEAAARSFFRKSAGELSLHESALLAGLIRAPSYYNPRRHPERAQARRNVVLSLLEENGDISDQAAGSAKAQKVLPASPLYTARYAPFFENALHRSLDSLVYLDAVQSNAGRVITGLSVKMQQCGERALSRGLQDLEKRYPRLSQQNEPLQGGLVALDPASGLIRAWVGGRDYSKNQYDHVIQAKRPIGSTVKPFIYLTALDPNLNSYKTATLRSILPDQPITVELPNGKEWRPSNADKKFRGDVTLRYALEHSLNLPPIHVTRRVGILAVQRTLKSFHIHDNPPPVLSLSLGALESDLLSLTAAYGAISYDGRYVAPRFFDKIIDQNGETLYQTRLQERGVVDAGAAFLVADALRGVIKRGTGSRAQPSSGFAFAGGKTGTTQDARDAWFVGFSGRIAAGVWVGFDNNTPVHVSGGSAAAPIWREFMECSQEVLDDPTPLAPRNVTRVALDGVTGDLFSGGCPKSQLVYELFLYGTTPSTPCALHSGVVESGGTSSQRQYAERKQEQIHESEEPESPSRPNFFERLFGF